MDAATMHRRIRIAFLLAVFAAALTIGAATSARMRMAAAAPVGFANGTAAAAFQAAFEKALPFKDASIQAYASLRWALFGEGFKGVAVGRDGWLYSAEEFEEDLGYLEGDFATAAARVRDELASLGATVLVVVVPSKARIYPEHLRPRYGGAYHRSRYGALLSVLDDLGVPRTDLYAAFRGKSGLFLRSDTHWSPAGARLAAEAVSEEVAALPGTGAWKRTSFVSRLVGTELHSGDLLSFLPSRGVPWRAEPEADELELYETSEVDAEGLADAADLFGAQELPVALVGTSFSAGKLWNFAGFLKESLGTDVLDLSEKGVGPFAPMRKALEGGLLREAGVRLVIWEIPERYVGEAALPPPR